LRHITDHRSLRHEHICIEEVRWTHSTLFPLIVAPYPILGRAAYAL
jgi:hypothetical protein